MYIDARHLENHSLIEGDVCIIGSGAAGISMALDWINTPYKIILLEGGGFEVDEKMQDSFKGKTTGQRYFPLQSSRLHCFGGTTGHWAGYCSTFDSIDFKKREWVPNSGWPIQREDLDTYYPRANKLVDIGPYPYDLKFWQKKDSSLVPLPFNENVIWNKIWQFSPPTRFGTKYKDTIVHAHNIHLYTYANAVNIDVNENVSAVKEIFVRNLEGKEHIVRAKYFVMACCAIQNARLLLVSNNVAPKGLGNDNDLVGRHFMDHLEVKSADLVLPKAAPLKLYMNDFFVTKMRAELAVHEKKQEEFKILNGTASLTPKLIAKDNIAMIDKFTDDAQKTIKMWEDMKKEFKDGKTLSTSTMAFGEYELFTRIEQSPNPSSRVYLDTEKDAFGMPRANLNWVLTPLEKNSIRKLYELIGQQSGAAGAGRVRMMDWLADERDNSWPSFLGGGWHHMGTTKMSDDPKDGVVDRNCKVHGIKNLYVAGSSCFATSGAANPTLTLIALTLRLSDHLKTIIAKEPNKRPKTS